MELTIADTYNTTYTVNHEQDYIPVVRAGEHPHVCGEDADLSLPREERCCSSNARIDKVIAKAYENGVQTHLGVRLAETYPCIPIPELNKLSDDIEQKTELYGLPLNPLPEGLDPKERPSAAYPNVVSFCKEVMFDKLSHLVGKVTDSKPMAYTEEVAAFCEHVYSFR